MVYMKKNLDKPFPKAILSRAEKIAKNYLVTIKENKKLGFIGSSVELPTVFADGKTLEKCYKAIREALIVAVATMIECGQEPPQPKK